MAAPSSTEQTLAWERRRRPRAGLAALAGALAILLAAILRTAALQDAPRAWWGDALTRAVSGEPVGGAPSLRIPTWQHYDDNAALLLLAAVVAAAGSLATGWALYVLARATAARRQEFFRAAIYIPLIAGVMGAIAPLLVNFSLGATVNDFLDGPRTVDAATEINASAGLVAGQYIGFFGSNLLLPLALVLISLNAMRAGLLTRFMGILGVIAAALILFPIGSPIPIVQFFWLGALAVLFFGRWPNGEPPAWRSGQAEPWPSAAEVREQRARQSGAPTPATQPAVPAGRPPRDAPARKRKRKRRS